jgi:hypothetical protein
MIAAVVVAVCLSFVVRAERLRAVASEKVHQFSRLARGRGTATAEDWQAYHKAQEDLLKADFLESFGVVVMILVPVAGVALAVRSRRATPAPSE